MKRRGFLQTTGIISLTVALSPQIFGAIKSSQPDVIIFMPDQWNPRFTGYAGAQVKTPNIDRMAQEGMIFDGCYTPCPMCMPARCSLVSGLYPHNLQLWSNGSYNLDPDDCRLFRDMQSAGYYTAEVGKIHRYSGDSWKKWFDSFDQLIKASGIDYTDKLITPFTIEGAKGEYRKRLEKLGLFEAYCMDSKDRQLNNDYVVRPAVVAPEDHVDTYTADRALELINRHPVDKPLFLKITFPGPHVPLDASGKYATMYDPEKLDLLPNVKPFDRNQKHYDDAAIKEMYGSYFGKLTMIDEGIGRIIEALKQRGTWDNTLAFFTSDHGEMIGSQGRVSKGVFYEESGRVPLVIRWSGHIPSGKRSDALVQLMDIYPTAVEAAGGKLSGSHFAVSLMPIATGVKAQVRDAVFGEIENSRDRSFMCRKGDYKWFMLKGDEFLFNIKDDPYEMKNLVKDLQYAAVLMEVKDRHAKYMRETQVNRTAGYIPQVERTRMQEQQKSAK